MGENKFRKKTFKDKMARKSKFAESYKPTDSRSSMNPKFNKPKEKHTNSVVKTLKPVIKRKY